jgi:ComF family protein
VILRAGKPILRKLWDFVGHESRAVSNLLFPPACLYCDGDIAAPTTSMMLCEPCLKELTPQSGSRCNLCGGTVSEFGAGQDDKGCGHCRDTRLHFDTVMPLGSYQGELRSAVLRMKRSQDEPLAAAMAELLWSQVGIRLAGWRPDVVVPIPMFWFRRWVRGTNSPEIVSALLAKKLRVPVSLKGLNRKRNTKPQGTLPPGHRFQNVRDAIGLNPSFAWNDARVLLIDDILTTGATCSEAARVLKKAGAAAVAVAVVARAHGPD